MNRMSIFFSTSDPTTLKRDSLDRRRFCLHIRRKETKNTSEIINTAVSWIMGNFSNVSAYRDRGNADFEASTIVE